MVNEFLALGINLAFEIGQMVLDLPSDRRHPKDAGPWVNHLTRT
jgi:hypothetical protein